MLSLSSRRCRGHLAYSLWNLPCLELKRLRLPTVSIIAVNSLSYIKCLLRMDVPYGYTTASLQHICKPQSCRVLIQYRKHLKPPYDLSRSLCHRLAPASATRGSQLDFLAGTTATSLTSIACSVLQTDTTSKNPCLQDLTRSDRLATPFSSWTRTCLVESTL